MKEMYENMFLTKILLKDQQKVYLSGPWCPLFNLPQKLQHSILKAGRHVQEVMMIEAVNTSGCRRLVALQSPSPKGWLQGGNVEADRPHMRLGKVGDPLPICFRDVTIRIPARFPERNEVLMNIDNV